MEDKKYADALAPVRGRDLARSITCATARGRHTSDLVEDVASRDPIRTQSDGARALQSRARVGDSFNVPVNSVDVPGTSFDVPGSRSKVAAGTGVVGGRRPREEYGSRGGLDGFPSRPTKKPKRLADNTAACRDTSVSAEDSTTCDDSILREAATRLVWTRLHEVETLKTRLQDLATAIARAEEIRQSVEALIDRDLVVALDVASSRMTGQPDMRYKQSFSAFFRALIGHICP